MLSIHKTLPGSHQPPVRPRCLRHTLCPAPLGRVRAPTSSSPPLRAPPRRAAIAADACTDEDDTEAGEGLVGTDVVSFLAGQDEEPPSAPPAMALQDFLLSRSVALKSMA